MGLEPIVTDRAEEKVLVFSWDVLEKWQPYCITFFFLMVYIHNRQNQQVLALWASPQSSRV